MRETCLTGTLIQPLKIGHYDYTNTEFDFSKMESFMSGNGITINRISKVGDSLEICYSVSDPEIIKRIMPPKKKIKCSVGALA
ncbi:MAG: hypothetical protein FWB73_05915 [Treponema sp.]|nr:hypothetical protein [Treponema sp.]